MVTSLVCWEVSEMPDWQIFIDKVITATSVIWQWFLTAAHTKEKREGLVNWSPCRIWKSHRNCQSWPSVLLTISFDWNRLYRCDWEQQIIHGWPAHLADFEKDSSLLYQLLTLGNLPKMAYILGMHQFSYLSVSVFL